MINKKGGQDATALAIIPTDETHDKQESIKLEIIAPSLARRAETTSNAIAKIPYLRRITSIDLGQDPPVYRYLTLEDGKWVYSESETDIPLKGFGPLPSLSVVQKS